jgi:hypothetical protein
VVADNSRRKERMKTGKLGGRESGEGSVIYPQEKKRTFQDKLREIYTNVALPPFS